MSRHNRERGIGAAFLRSLIGYRGNKCVTWPLSLDNHGYGRFGYGGDVFKAHRYMCELEHGPPASPDLQAAHSCGVTNCVNPRHLRWATNKENMADSVRLGVVRQKGTPRYKLSIADVAEIKKLKGTAPYHVIAERYGVKGKQIGKIMRGEQWKLGVRTHAGKPCRSQSSFE